MLAAARMMRDNPLVRRGAFFVPPLVSSLSPLLVLPAIARNCSANQWVAVGLGQSVGIIAAMYVMAGWSILGTTKVALTDDSTYRTLAYSQSIRHRGLRLLVAIPLIIVVASLFAHVAPPVVTATMSVPGLTLGLSPSWYLVGTGKATLIVLFDSLPRVIAALAALPIITSTGWIYAYPLLAITATIVSLYLFQKLCFPLGGVPESLAGYDRLPISVSELRSANFSEVTGAVFAMATVPAAAFAATNPRTQTAGLAELSSADRIYRFALLAVTALGNSVQAWALEDEKQRGRRIRTAVILHTTLGILGGAALLILGPWISRLMFGNNLGAGIAIFGIYAISYILISTATPLIRLIAIPDAGVRFVAVCTLASGVVGISAMLGLAKIFGPIGSAAGLSIAELTMVVTLAARALARRGSN